MARLNKQVEEEQGQGAPEWMVTFSDCMTLLLTFFVLLLTFSSFDDKVYKKLKGLYSDSYATAASEVKSNRNSLLYTPPIRYMAELDYGSETPTHEEEIEEGVINEGEYLDLNKGIILLIPSNKVFWGKGTTISTQGRQIIDELASFISEVTHRVVISEKVLIDDQISRGFSLDRAWVIVDYLTRQYNLDKGRFNISAAGTAAQVSYTDAAEAKEGKDAECVIEIALLGRSIYN